MLMGVSPVRLLVAVRSYGFLLWLCGADSSKLNRAEPGLSIVWNISDLPASAKIVNLDLPPLTSVSENRQVGFTRILSDLPLSFFGFTGFTADLPDK